MVGLAYNVFLHDPRSGDTFTLLFVSDVVALILLCTPRETPRQLGLGWAAVMTIGLLLPMSQYLGAGYFGSSAGTILFLSIIELLAIIKFGYDSLLEQARSWKNDSE
jgi:membrane-associated PAP2 superfamily phosphatase